MAGQALIPAKNVPAMLTANCKIWPLFPNQFGGFISPILLLYLPETSTFWDLSIHRNVKDSSRQATARQSSYRPRDTQRRAARPDFPAGKGQPNDPTRPVTSLKTAWTKVRDKANVVGRWHDNRHMLVTELAESGAGDEVIMSIAGHVSRAMLSRYSHVRMEAKRRALDEIAARQCAADAQRKDDAERREQAAAAAQPAVVQ